jgi:hypothetical protein
MVNSNTARASAVAVAVSASVSALRLENRYCFSDFLSSFLNGSPHIVLARSKDDIRMNSVRHKRLGRDLVYLQTALLHVR